MLIHNKTSVPVFCALDDRPAIQIAPGTQGTILTENGRATLRVEHLYSSQVCKLFKMDYVKAIVLNSRIALSGLQEESVCTITGERVHFTYGFAYDRFFCLCKNCQLEGQDLLPTQSPDFFREATVPADTTSDRIFDFFFDGVFGAAVGLFFLVKIASWIEGFFFSWWWLPVFLAAAFGIQILIEKFSYASIRMGYSLLKRKPGVVTDLEKYMQPEYIEAYYGNGQRKWIGRDRVPL